MLVNKEFIQSYELYNAPKITPKGCVNNRLYSTLEKELNKPFNEDLLLEKKVKVIEVFCIIEQEGGLLWEPKIWNLTTGESILEPGFIPEDRAITINIDEEGNKSQISNYLQMQADGYFGFKWTDAFCMIIQIGNEQHEFFYHETPFRDKDREILLENINSLVEQHIRRTNKSNVAKLPNIKEEVLVKLDNGIFAVAQYNGQDWLVGRGVHPSHEDGFDMLSGKVVSWDKLPVKLDNNLDITTKRPRMK